MKMKWPAIRFGCLLLAGAALTAFPASAQVAQEVEKRATSPVGGTRLAIRAGDCGGVDLDQDLVVLGDGLREVGEVQDIGRPVSVEDDSAHWLIVSV